MSNVTNSSLCSKERLSNNRIMTKRHPALAKLPVPPSLVYVLHQLDEFDIPYFLYGEVPNTDIVFVDIDRNAALNLVSRSLPPGWQMIAPHYISHRAVERGEDDPISAKHLPEAVVFAYAKDEAENLQQYQALVEQVKFLSEQPPSRLLYLKHQIPQPEEIIELFSRLKRH